MAERLRGDSASGDFGWVGPLIVTTWLWFRASCTPLDPNTLGQHLRWSRMVYTTLQLQ